jgi:hypothetical protein
MNKVREMVLLSIGGDDPNIADFILRGFNLLDFILTGFALAGFILTPP